MTSSLDRLMGRIRRLEREIRSGVNTPQLGSSSIEDNGRIEEYDNDDQLVQIIGTQYDGTHTTAQVAGPIPPAPSAPVVTPRPGGAIIAWDGTFADPATVAPMDFARVDVVIGGSQGFDTTAATPRVSYVSARGGEMFVPLPEGQHYAALVTRTQSGKVSASSAQEGFTAPAEVGGPPPIVPPTTSPIPTVTGLPWAIMLNLPVVYNDSPTEFDVYVSDTSPVAIAPENLYDTTTGSGVFMVRNLPDGTEFLPNTSYYIVVVARNELDETAPPSPEIAAQLRLVDTPDVSAEYAYLGQIFASQIDSGEMNAEVSLAGLFEVRGDNDARVGMSKQRGFYVEGASPGPGLAGPTLVEFPINGAPNIVSGNFEAENLVTTQSAILSKTTEVAPGGEVVLVGQIQPPKTAPQVKQDWHHVEHAPNRKDDAGYGLTRGHDGKWYSTRTQSGITFSTVEVYNDDGTLDRSHALGWDFAARDIVYASHHGGRYYILVTNAAGTKWHIEARDTAFSLIKRTNTNIDILNPRRPTLGWDYIAGRLLLAFASGGTWLTVDQMGADASGNLTTYNSWEHDNSPNYQYDLAFVARGTFDLGVDRLVIKNTANNEPWRVYTPTNLLVRETQYEWQVVDGIWVYGACWDPTTGKFWHIDGNERRWRYEGGRAYWSTGNANRSAAVSYYDSKTPTRTVIADTTNGSATVTSSSVVFGPGDVGSPISGTGIPASTTISSVGVDGKSATMSKNATATSVGVSLSVTSITHETSIGPRTDFVHTKRARYVVTVNHIPQGAGGHDDPDQARIYTAGSWAGTLYREGAITAPDTSYTVDMDIAAPTTNPAPATNSFPVVSPSKFKSTTGGFEVDSASNGSIGTGTLRDSVRAAVHDDAGWELLSLTSNWIHAGNALEIRKVGKTVYIQGSIQRKNATLTATPETLCSSNLAAKYRPKSGGTITLQAATWGTSGPNPLIRIDSADGSVLIRNRASTAVPIDGFVDFAVSYVVD